MNGNKCIFRYIDIVYSKDRLASLTIQKNVGLFCAILGFDTPILSKSWEKALAPPHPVDPFALQNVCREPVKRVDAIVQSCNAVKMIEIKCV